MPEMRLPAQNVPWPATLDTAPRGDLYKSSQPVFALDEALPEYLKAKLEVAQQPWAALLATDADLAALKGCVHRLLEHLCVEQPVLLEQTAVGWKFNLTGVTISGSFDLALERGAWLEAIGERIVERVRLEETGARACILAIALNIQDDLALMRGDVAEGLWVMLPSTWNPSEKIGLPLASIHKPVPNSDALQRATPNLTRAVLERGPFERFVWTVQASPRLPMHPAQVMPDDGGAYWRIERQTFYPMPELGRYWFVIRVHVVPLPSVLNPDRARGLQHALEQIASSLTQHKRLEPLLPRIAAILEPYLTGTHA
jgi:Protein of unknown function (DUF3445)